MDYNSGLPCLSEDSFPSDSIEAVLQAAIAWASVHTELGDDPKSNSLLLAVRQLESTSSEVSSGENYRKSKVASSLPPPCKATSEELHQAVEEAKVWRDSIEQSTAQLERFDFSSFADKKALWSEKTYGPGDRYHGVIKHIQRELVEIEQAPDDLEEWVDVILLAMDGAWRSANASGRDLANALIRKQEKNTRRKWPDWRSLKEDEVSHHISEDPEHE